MRVAIYIENSEGAEVKVFDEHVRSDQQLEILRDVLGRCIFLERGLKGYVETLGENDE